MAVAGDDRRSQGRESFRTQAWADAYACLAAADRAAPLDPDDLERLAVSAYLVGHDEDSAEAWTRALAMLERAGRPRRAARCAFWLALELINTGELARAGGWVARGQRLLEAGGPNGVAGVEGSERGLLMLPPAVAAVYGGDPAGALPDFIEAAAIGDHHGDHDLMTLGRLGQGQALIALGRPAEGLALLDEAMAAVSAGEVSPLVTGVAYCAVVSACYELYDLRRAREWTSALSHWCEAQPDLVPYRGECLVHRSQIMTVHGLWSDALAEARRACERLAKPPQPALGLAIYQRGELHRLRGEFALAEQAYREANHWGHEPQPGLALLRLVQGRVTAAAASIRRAVDETSGPLARTRRLPAYVEISLAAGDVALARAGAEELAQTAATVDVPALRAVAGVAMGAVRLAEGDARAALEVLRRAWREWQELDTPYEAARTRVLLGLACRALGDEDGAALELDAARWVFTGLGAPTDAARVDALVAASAPGAPGGLTAREVQVLRLVAAGRTNRAIAGDLFLSEKTVARHLSNIFAKLDVASRSAATAYAYEHGLV